MIRSKLVEIGTTNKVRISDFKEAFEEQPVALVMRAHRSNFKIVGFTEEPEFSQVVEVAHQHNVLVVDDLGSGALVDTAKYGFAHEPTVQESLAAGADLVCFSGDKLLGGPQAGIIVGRKDLLEKIKKHPLARAVRADKTCLAGITATLTHYLRDEAEREIPVLRMLTEDLDSIRRRAERLGGDLVEGESEVGGGSFPGATLKTWLVAVRDPEPDALVARLRAGDPPIIARILDGRVVLDPRTILPAQIEAVARALRG